VALSPYLFLRAIYRFLAICALFIFSNGVHAAVPAAPAVVSAMSVSGYAYISWTPVSDATSYRIQKLFGRDPPLSSTGTDVLDVLVTIGNTYTYQVSACNSSGCSTAVNTNAVTIVSGPPNMPTGVTAAASGTAIVIGWSAVANTSSYTIQKTVNGAVSNITGVSGTTYTDSNLSPGTTYTYNVKACNSAGCSAISAGASATTASAAPAAPANVSAMSVAGYAYVSWSAVSGATSYRVLKVNGMTPAVTTTATDYADTSSQVGVTYTYQVSACNGGGCSNPVTTNPVTVAAPAPNMPTNVSAAASGSAIVVGWGAVSGATSYTIQKTVGGSVSTIPGVSGTSYVDSSVSPGTTYTYNVKACNSAGCSALSGGASATAAVAVPASPTNVSASSGNGYAYISWSAVSGATSYRVQKVNSTAAPLTTTATGIADTAVTVGSTYTYAVSACNSSGCSATVNTNAVSILPTVPGIPANVTATASGASIVIGWSAASGATSYTIQKTVGGTVSTISGVGGTSYVDSSLSPGAVYTYNVKACNSGGCSGNSAAASATAPAAVPAAPANVSASSIAGYAYVSWSAVSGATSYRILKVNGMTPAVTTTATDYADTSTQVGNTYTYQVSACNGSGCSNPVTTNAVTVAAPPPNMPTGVTATASGPSIVIGWTAVSGATSYTIQKTVGGTVSNIAGVTGTSYTDASLTPGSVYTYNVKACNSAGCSAISAGASATAPAAIPAAPANVSASSIAGYAYVSWSAVSGATSYRILKVNGMTPAVTTTATDYADTSTTVGNTYTYQVSACNSSGCSNPVTTNAVTVAAPPPNMPTTLSVTPGNNALTISWPAVSGATYYSLQRSPTGSGFPVASIASTSYVDSGLPPSTTYSYNLRACNSAGCSAWSSPVSGTTKALSPPQAPASLAAAQSGATVVLSWPAPANATLYKLRRTNGSVVATWPDIATTTATDGSVAVDTDYVYQVQACNSSGCSSMWTSSATIRLPHVPAPPATVTAKVLKYGISINWSSTDNATSFKLLRNGVEIAVLMGAPFTDTGPVGGTSYVYGVSACNATGCSAVTSAKPVTAGTVPAGAVQETYEYDALGRLNKVYQDGAMKTQYDYDGAGNRTQVTEPAPNDGT